MVLTIQGIDAEEKFKQIEHILNSFQRRLTNKVVGVIPPVVIPFNNNQAVIPITGTILNVCVFVNNYSVREASVTVRYYGNGFAYSNDFLCKSTLERFVLNWNTEGGGLLELVFSPDEMTGVMCSAVIEPDKQSYISHSYLLDEILALEEAENREIMGELE